MIPDSKKIWPGDVLGHIKIAAKSGNTDLSSVETIFAQCGTLDADGCTE
jgi:hypothetical protein